MKRCMTKLWLIAAMLFFAAVPATQADAADFDPPVVAVLDVQRIIAESVAAADLRTQVEKYNPSLQEEFKGKENELRSEDEELKRQATVLAEDKLKEKSQALKQKASQVMKEADAARRTLEAAYNRGLKEIEVALNQVVQKIADEGDIDLVLVKGQVFYVGADLDITQRSLIALNKRISTVKLQVEKS